MSAATTTPPREWLVIIPDHKDALSKRLEVRSQHLTGVTPHVQSGKITMGGATMHAHPELDHQGPPDMSGSALVVVADTREEVLELLKGDVYAKSGVWDVEGVVLYPFRSAVRTPL